MKFSARQDITASDIVGWGNHSCLKEVARRETALKKKKKTTPSENKFASSFLHPQLNERPHKQCKKYRAAF